MKENRPEVGAVDPDKGSRHATERQPRPTQVCRDFLKGKCHRANCRFLHIAGAPREICIDFLRGRCNRPNCRYLHSSDSKAGNKPGGLSAGQDSEQIHSDDEEYELDEQQQQQLQQQNLQRAQQEAEEQRERNATQTQQLQQSSQQPNPNANNIAEMLKGYEELTGIAQLEQRLLDRFTVDAAAQGLYKLF